MDAEELLAKEPPQPKIAGAIFALSHGDDVPPAEFAYLRAIFPRVTSDRMKEQILMGMGEDKSNGSAWLIGRARDAGECPDFALGRRRGDQPVQWQYLAHEQFDGIGGLANVLRGEGEVSFAETM